MLSKKAFTLIELLVVIAIVGILSGILIATMNGATGAARDAKRKSDVDQIRKALLIYKTRFGNYPIQAASCQVGNDISCPVLDAALKDNGYFSTIPTDPDGTYYSYISADGTDFTIGATLSNSTGYSYTASTGFGTVGGGGAAAWLSGYAKREPITITSSSVQTGYQVLLSIPYDSDMQVDLRDLRFTSSDKTTLIDYWIESSASPAKVWVEVPSLAIGANTIYVYYGNGSATSASNGSDTFTLFDNFDGASVDASKWTTSATPPTVSGSRISSGSSAVQYQALSKSSFSYNNRIVMYGYYKTSGVEASALGFYPRLLGQTTLNFQGNSLQSTGRTSGADYRWEVIRNGSTNSVLNVNGAYALTDSYNSSNNNAVDLYASNGALTGFSVDWLLVGKYANPEPTFSIGAEEAN